MIVDWKNKWVKFSKGNKVVKLQVQEEQTIIHMREGREVVKELKVNNEVLIGGCQRVES
jgi:hypothetical protein